MKNRTFKDSKIKKDILSELKTMSKCDKLYKLAIASFLGFAVSGLIVVGCGLGYTGNRVAYNNMKDNYYDEMLNGNVSLEEYDEITSPFLKTSDELKIAIYSSMAISELCLVVGSGLLIGSETVETDKKKKGNNKANNKMNLYNKDRKYKRKKTEEVENELN